MRTDVVIIGSGPAGLLLGHLLRQAGVDTVIIERNTRDHVEGRIRAGVLERTTADLLGQLGLDGRMRREGMIERGFNLADGERLIRIDLDKLIGKDVIVYGQTEVTRDLIGAAADRELPIVWHADNVTLNDVDGDSPYVTFERGGAQERVDCDFIAGCDGFHGPSRRAIPVDSAREFRREFPFGWLGILADVPPCNDELIYSNHTRGFALASMRSPTRSRYYLQVPLSDRVEDWEESRVWDELDIRLGAAAGRRITRGPALEMSIAPLRSYVLEPMSHGRLFLAGDAAHIVPPTGAKGLNLAASDVAYLAQSLIDCLRGESEESLKSYSGRAARRVWKAQRFSWYLTNLMHRFPDTGPFERAMQVAELDYISSSTAMQTAIAENYVGLPL